MAKRLRPLIRHSDPGNCSTCLWLSTHAGYEREYTCEDKACGNCRLLHRSCSVKWLKGLKRSDSEFALLLELNTDDSKSRLEQFDPSGEIVIHQCVEKYAQKYLAHVLRDGDCISLFEERPDNDGVFVYYNKNFHHLSNEQDLTCHLPSFIDITLFGRANYFSKAIEGNSIVWSSFSGYDGKCIRKDREKYALWEMANNLDQVQALISKRLITDITDMVIGYLQDKWYVFATLNETIKIGSKPSRYEYQYGGYDCGTGEDTNDFHAQLLSAEDRTISDKAKILYTSGFQYGED